MNRKPRLVDYSLFHKPKTKVIKKPIIIDPKIIDKTSDNSLLVNLIGLLILCMGGLCLYQRLKDRDKDELEKQNVIIGFHQYVKDKIK